MAYTKLKTDWPWVFIITAFIVLSLWTASYIWQAKAGTIDTSGLTAADVISDVRYYLRDTEQPYRWPDAQLLIWIDEAIRETVNRTRCLESGTSRAFIIDAFRRAFEISGRFLDIEKVEYDTGDTTIATQIFDLSRVPFTKLREGRQKEVGDPKTFAMWGDKMYVWPIPGSSQSGTCLYVFLNYLPSGVSLTTSPIETPAYLDTALLHHIKAQAMMENGEEEKAQFYMGLWLNRCMSYRQDIMRRESPAPPGAPK